MSVHSSEALPMEPLIERYLTDVRIERGLAHNTVEAYRRDLHTLQTYMLGRRLQHPAELTREALRAFLQYLARMKLSPASIARSLATLRGFCRFLVKERVIAENPILLIQSGLLLTPQPAKQFIDTILGLRRAKANRLGRLRGLLWLRGCLR